MTDEADRVHEPGTELVRVDIPRPALINVELGIGAFIGRVLGRPLEQAGGVLADLLGMVRFELSIPYLKRAQRLLAEAGLEQEPLPRADLTKLLPILEWGSIQGAGDESMRSRWDNLLANAIGAPDSVHPAYADILRQLQPVEARALDLLVGDCMRPMARWSWEPQSNIEGLEQSNLDNLERLGLIRFFSDAPLGDFSIDRPPPSANKVVATALGVTFVVACRAPKVATN